MAVSAEELLAGGALKHEIEIPYGIVHPENSERTKDNTRVEKEKFAVVLKPLTVRDIQLITKAAKENEILTSSLIVQKGVVEPTLDQNQIAGMHAGLVRFLVDKIQEISGISTNKDTLSEMVQAPLSRACFILAKEFGWTPQQVSEMTIGQILLYVEMLNNGNGKDT